MQKQAFGKILTAATILSLLCLPSLGTVLATSPAHQTQAQAMAWAAPLSPATSCTAQQVGRAEGRAGSPVSSQSVRDFAQSLLQFKSETTGYAVSYEGYADEWKVNSATCSVSWHDASANFVLQDSKGDKYVLVISEDPTLGVIYGITRTGYAVASIPTNTSPTYSGYQVANDSSTPHSTPVTFAYGLWYVPTPSAPTGTGAPSCKYDRTASAWGECWATTWVGLQNSTYNGNSGFTGTGEVVQTGTHANFTCASTGSTCYSSAISWTEYVRRGNSGNTTYIVCYFGGHGGSIGDEMTAEVGSQQQVYGTSGNYYDTILWDLSYGYSCSHAYPTTTQVHTEYFADYITERPGYYGSPVHLPKFSTFTLQNLQMGTGTSKQFGSYPNYNNGWGMGTYMYNSGTRDTTTSSMSSTGGQGSFTETWDSSNGA